MFPGFYPTWNKGRDRGAYFLDGATDGSGNWTLDDDYDGDISVAGTTTQTISGLPKGAKRYKAFAVIMGAAAPTVTSYTSDLSAGTLAIALSGAVATQRIAVAIEVQMSPDD